MKRKIQLCQNEMAKQFTDAQQDGSCEPYKFLLGTELLRILQKAQTPSDSDLGHFLSDICCTRSHSDRCFALSVVESMLFKTSRRNCIPELMVVLGAYNFLKGTPSSVMKLLSFSRISMSENWLGTTLDNAAAVMPSLRSQFRPLGIAWDNLNIRKRLRLANEVLRNSQFNIVNVVEYSLPCKPSSMVPVWRPADPKTRKQLLTTLIAVVLQNESSVKVGSWQTAYSLWNHPGNARSVCVATKAAQFHVCHPIQEGDLKENPLEAGFDGCLGKKDNMRRMLDHLVRTYITSGITSTLTVVGDEQAFETAHAVILTAPKM